jgi:hypothetical protein
VQGNGTWREFGSEEKHIAVQLTSSTGVMATHTDTEIDLVLACVLLESVGYTFAVSWGNSKIGT